MSLLILLFLILIPPLPVHAGLLFSSEYNDGTFGGASVCSGATCPSGFPSVPISAAKQLISTPSRLGAGAVKLILLPTYSGCFIYGQGPFSGASACDRSEFERFGMTHVGDERWYGLSIYVDPTYTDTTADPNGTIISQWHDSPDPCDILKSPHLYIGITKAPYHWRVRNQYDPNPCTTNIAINRVDYDLGPMTTGVWVDFVVHAKWSYTGTGVLQVWMNGSQVLNLTGPNIYNDQQPQNWKWGPYKSWWVSHPPSLTDKIPVYYDQIRLGDANSSYAEVSPGVATPTLTAPTNLAVILGP